MNFVNVMGGLGNQLFQYTFHKYCEKKSGHATVLYTEFFNNVSSMEGYTNRGFKLDRFGCDFVSINGNLTAGKIEDENSFQGIERGVDDVFYSGYWQGKDFFEEVKEDLKKELCLKEEYVTSDVSEAAREILESNSVAIHFRRGDYLNADNINLFSSLSLEYYKDALSQIINAGGENIKAFIFTDDIPYVSGIMGQLGDIEMKLMPMRADYEDLYLMSLARHHIIANSTFSWWGAVLSKDETGITIAPKNWFLDRPSPDLYLDNWIVM